MSATPAPPLLVVTTVATREQALALARTMVERRLAACAQLSAIESLYSWQGRIAHEPEFRVLFKTQAEHYPALEAALRAEHPYTLPAIHALATDRAEPAYAEWVAAQCGDAG